MEVEKHLCKCTIIQNLFRYNKYYSSQTDELASDMLKQMFVNNEYKDILSDNFCKMFNFLSANAIGNLAYVCVNCKDESLKELAKQKLIEIFIWKVKVYQSFLETINSIN